MTFGLRFGYTTCKLYEVNQESNISHQLLNYRLSNLSDIRVNVQSFQSTRVLIPICVESKFDYTLSTTEAITLYAYRTNKGNYAYSLNVYSSYYDEIGLIIVRLSFIGGGLCLYR